MAEVRKIDAKIALPTSVQTARFPKLREEPEIIYDYPMVAQD